MAVALYLLILPPQTPFIRSIVNLMVDSERLITSLLIHKEFEGDCDNTRSKRKRNDKFDF